MIACLCTDRKDRNNLDERKQLGMLREDSDRNHVLEGMGSGAWREGLATDSRECALLTCTWKQRQAPERWGQWGPWQFFLRTLICSRK